MRLIFIFFIFGNLINIFYALVCPIYLPRYQQKSLIKTCHSNCSFRNISEQASACLGVYSNHSGELMIKQLGIISSDEQCLRSKECLLDIDPLNSQSFSCCCSTNNCTLNWKSVPITTTTTTTYRSILITDKTINIEQNHFSWKLFLIIFILIMISILIIFTFGLWKSLRNQDNRQFLKQPSSSSSSSIEQVFFSAQQINIGKNSIVYKTIIDNDLVALKVYKQTNMLIWKNEVTLLKSIKHESIIKILSEGQYNSHLYLVFPYYENDTLQSYLRTSNRTLSIHQCLTYFRSLASAISYLHLGQTNTHTTIVHRDIKSSNILIGKNEWNLYLADFGVALALPQVLTEKDFVQIGTIRYMAPELLEGVIAHTREALCSVDMYALALVMWEIITQCDVYPATVYRPPYEEYVTNISDESFFAAQLYDIVVIRKCRPTLIRELKEKEYASIIYELCSLIDACWTTDSDMRMNAQTLAFKLNHLM